MRYPTWTHSLILVISLIFAFGAQCKVIPHPTSNPGTTPTANLEFHSAEAQKYKVPRKLPLMDFLIPQTYAGLMKLSDKPDETENLFFWLIPGEVPAAKNKLALWTNGGPGCSSLLGAFQENGPVMWDKGRTKPIANPNSWSKVASIVYLEHPVGVGFSTGKAIISNEDQVAEYIFKFLTNFLRIFPEFGGSIFYLTGESFAGMYLSYTANLIYKRQSQLALQLEGVLFIDPVLSTPVLQEDAPIYPLIKLHQDAFKFNSTFMSQLEAAYKSCGYADLIDKYLKYPPPGKFPDIMESQPTLKCQLWYRMAEELPDNFNIYNILLQGNGPDPLFDKPLYLDRPDVRKALNVHGTAPWSACSHAKNIFPKGDSSYVPSYKVLPQVIAKGKRTIIAHGELDGRLPIQGMSLALQAMTWAGTQGFTKPVDSDFMVDGKSSGKFITQRGLTFVQVKNAGHMIPHDTQEAGLAIFEYLIGNRASL